MTGSEIRELVIVKLEEYTPFGDTSGETLLAGGDLLQEVKPVYSYVDKMLPEAANEALLIIPLDRLSKIAKDGLEQSYVIIPGDTSKYYRDESADTAITTDNVVMGIKFVLDGETVAAYYDEESSDASQNVFAWKDGNNTYYTEVRDMTMVGSDVYDSEEMYRHINFVLEIMRVKTNSLAWNNGSSIIYTIGSYYYTSIDGTSYAGSTRRHDKTECIPDTDDNRIGVIVKSADWLRLHTLLMAGWKKPVHFVIHPDHPEYAHQHSVYSRGNSDKPIVVDMGTELHYYSQTNSATKGEIKRLLYIPMFALATDYPLDVAEAIALNVAGKVLTIFGLGEQLTLLTKDLESVFTTMKI